VRRSIKSGHGSLRSSSSLEQFDHIITEVDVKIEKSGARRLGSNPIETIPEEEAERIRRESFKQPINRDVIARLASMDEGGDGDDGVRDAEKERGGDEDGARRRRGAGGEEDEAWNEEGGGGEGGDGGVRRRIRGGSGMRGEGGGRGLGKVVMEEGEREGDGEDTESSESKQRKDEGLGESFDRNSELSDAAVVVEMPVGERPDTPASSDTPSTSPDDPRLSFLDPKSRRAATFM
jgi:hypothetical protein